MSNKVLLWIVVAAVGLRLATALYLGEAVEALPGINDQISYHVLATRVLSGHGFTFGRLWWPLTQAGQPTAHWSYLYTLFLAGLYALFGVHPLAPRLVQAVAGGLLMPWLTYRLGRRAFGKRAGLIAAAWAAAYGYFVYYAAALMTETFYFLGILWTLDVTLRLGEAEAMEQTPRREALNGLRVDTPNGWRLWGELGLAIALTAHLRQVFLLFVPFLYLWLAGATWRRRASAQTGAPPAWADLIRGSLFSALVVALAIAPVTLHNYRQFHRLVLLNTNAGYALFWANHPVYGDQFMSVLRPDMPSYRELIPPELRGLDEAALESALMQRGVGFVLADPGRYLRLSLSRAPIYFQFWPSADSSGLSSLVRTASFGLALPFMLTGIGLWAAGGLRLRKAWAGSLLLLFAAVYSLIHLLSWALIRYRLPVDAVLLVFAGRALAALWQATRARLGAGR